MSSFCAPAVGFSIGFGTRVQDRIVRNVDSLRQVGWHEEESVLDLLGVQCSGNCNFSELGLCLQAIDLLA